MVGVLDVVDDGRMCRHGLRHWHPDLLHLGHGVVVVLTVARHETEPNPTRNGEAKWEYVEGSKSWILLGIHLNCE